MNSESRGSATWKKKHQAVGLEPDACYYVANAGRIIGRRLIDLETDPPPALAIEIDSTNESLSKFAIYSALGVCEIWRYDVRKNRLVMYELRGDQYAQIPISRSFPILTDRVIGRFIDESKTAGEKAAISAFRDWLRTQS